VKLKERELAINGAENKYKMKKDGTGAGVSHSLTFKQQSVTMFIY